MRMVGRFLGVMCRLGLIVGMIEVPVVRLVLGSALGLHAVCRRTDHGGRHCTPEG